MGLPYVLDEGYRYQTAYKSHEEHHHKDDALDVYNVPHCLNYYDSAPLNERHWLRASTLLPMGIL